MTRLKLVAACVALVALLPLLLWLGRWQRVADAVDREEWP